MLLLKFRDELVVVWWQFASGN